MGPSLLSPHCLQDLCHVETTYLSSLLDLLEAVDSIIADEGVLFQIRF